jgi:hypothetical protein
MGKNKAKSTTALNRRWFADMSGWGVSLQLGSGEPSKGRRSLPASIEAKFNTTAVTVSNGLCNTLYTFNPLSVITQGTGSNNREGAGIHLKAVSFRYNLESPGSSSVTWRMMLVAATPQFNMANFGSGIGSNQLFLSASYNNVLVPHVDSRLAKVLCDTTVMVQPSVTGVQVDSTGFFDCEINMPFEFQSSGVYGTASNLYIIVMPYIPGGTTGSTPCGSLTGEVMTCWTD